MNIDKEYILKILNEAHDADPMCLQSMLCGQFTTNELLTDHPTIPVHSRPCKNGEGKFVGILDIINGFLTESGSHVTLKWSETKNKDGQHTLLGFELIDLVKPE